MMRRTTFVLAMMAVGALSLEIGAQNRQRSINTGDGRRVSDCGDIRVDYERRPAITETAETTLSPSQVSTLVVEVTRGGTFVNGWDRNEYSVKTCKAVPDDPDATSTLHEINTTVSNSQITVSGPTGKEWSANLILMVPRLTR